MISVPDAGVAGARGELCGFRREFYRCLPRRADALFELADAVLTADGPVRSLVELSLAGVHRRGMAACMRRWPGAGVTVAGCAAPWPGCRCRGRPMGGWCWRWMSPVGCARRRIPR